MSHKMDSMITFSLTMREVQK